MTSSMFKCFEDPERDNALYLVVDPSVSCEPSLMRKVIRIHAGLISLLVGVGFPLISYLSIRALKKDGKLDFDSAWVSAD